jgi:NADP-dependent 3-hydroxy acid dehydrogenase YdfG
MKKAVVMGASSGIGMEVAKLLLADGWIIGVAARRTDLLEQLKDTAPERVVMETIDVNADGAEDMLLSLIVTLGGMDLFFYAPGIGWQNPTLEPEKENNTVTTNALGFTRMVGTAFRYMATHGGGHVAVVTSIAGTKGLGPAPAYSATKAFQNTYLQALEQQANARKLNIRFTDLRPGFVDTALLGDGNRYPMLLRKEDVAYEMVEAIRHHKHIWVIDWRWRILTALWRRIPRWVWRRLNLNTKSSQ